MLDLAFSTKSLRQLCERQARAERELGTKAAKNLRRRLADLRAAKSAKDLVAGPPDDPQGTNCRRIALDLGSGFRLVLSANHNVNPLLENGAMDWSKVTRVKILEIEVDND